MPKPNNKRKNLLDLSHSEALKFFIKHKSYCNFNLPPYVLFDPLLKFVHKSLKGEKLSKFYKSGRTPTNEEKVNHTILRNKDGKYGWRPIQLIHPALYISLVHSITKKEHWDTLRKRFKDFKNPHIECMSIPVIPSEETKTKSEQILSWLENVEQQSIKMSLAYEYLTHIDISNCYGSIYTHSISWAIHDKKKIKEGSNRRDQKLLGNIIDRHLMDMSHGQTNGIPQGSVLMDFIAEMVLGYIDTQIIKKIEEKKINEYHIIRYRDDYRIFTNNLKDGEEIVKCISEILIDYGMSLNPNKTKPTDQVIKGSIKPDKLYWTSQKQSMGPFQKHLLLIHGLSKKFPNSGSLRKALGKFYDRIKKVNNVKKAKKVKKRKERKELKDVYQLISIIVDIAYHNSVTYDIITPIISQLIKHINEKDEQKKIIERIREKFKKIPNTGHLDIWLQRVVIGFKENIDFDEPICEIVAEKNSIKNIWNFDWLEKELKQKIEDQTIVDRRELDEARGEPIKREEFAIFPEGY